MSLLEIVTNVANKAGYTVSASIVDSTDGTTKQLLQFAQEIIRDMADMYLWPVLQKTANIALIADTARYALPADWSHYHFDTFWNRDKGWRVMGPMSPQEYAEIVGSDVTTSVFDRFQISGASSSELLISPTPGAGDAGQVIIAEYVADRAVRPRTWTTGLSITTGAYIFYNGNYYTATTTGTTGATPPTHTSSTASDGGVTWSYYSGTYSRFLADTDEPMFKSRIVEQGIFERYAEIHGLAFTPRFDVQCAEEYGKKKGGKVLYAATGQEALRGQWGRNGRVSFGSV